MAVGKYLTTAKKLQAACRKRFGVRLLINTRQWFSEDKDRAITQYTLCQTVYHWEDGEKRNKHPKHETNTELFKTYSQVQLVLFLRDYWYELNGWEVPHDNETWEAIKAEYGRTKEPSAKEPKKASAKETSAKH